MAKKRQEPERPRTLSALEALIELNTIDRALDVYSRTAPVAFEAMGGRDVVRRLCENTCVGPVPRLTTEEWSAMAEEHAARARDATQGHAGKRVSRPEPRVEEAPSIRGRGFLGLFSR